MSPCHVTHSSATLLMVLPCWWTCWGSQLRPPPGFGKRGPQNRKTWHDVYSIYCGVYYQSICLYPGLPSTLQTKDVDITTFSQCMFYSFSGKITFSQSLIRFAEAALRLAGSALAASHIISPMILHGRLDPIS